jgi:hypothetical protein
VSFDIQLRAQVFADLVEIHVWYEGCRPGLGDRFVSEFFASLDILEHRPTAFAAYYRKVRHSLLKHFPYGVYFRIEGETVIVVRVFHCSREQSKLRKSLRDPKS